MNKADRHLSRYWPIIWSFSLAVAMTICYLIFSWYISNLWLILIGDPQYASGLSTFALNPIELTKDNPILLWQLLACVSLLINIFWAYKRTHLTDYNDGALLPILCHLLWLFSCTLLHVAGGMASFVYIGATIS